MTEGGSADRPCYALTMVQPFIELLRPYAELAPMLTELAARDLDARIPAEIAHRFLSAAVAYTGDADLGLKAARRLGLGDMGAIDYLTRSAATVRDALEVTATYVRLFNEVLGAEIELRDDRVYVLFHNSIVLPRAAADFQSGAIFNVHLRSWVRQELSDVEVLLTHAKPDNTREYDITFGPARVNFGVARSGFAFGVRHLETRLERADPNLHWLLRRHADDMLKALPGTQTFTQRVRDLAAAEIGSGPATVGYIARRLGVSARTLTRKLGREGTSYKQLLEDLRKTLALRYLDHRDLQASEVAVRVGFSKAATFDRAFRRWTGLTPLEHQRRQLR